MEIGTPPYDVLPGGGGHCGPSVASFPALWGDFAGGVLTWLLGIVGLQASHIPSLLGHEVFRQFRQAVLKLGGHLWRHGPG